MALPDGDEVLILHNPRCSKSRATVALLKERGIPFQERRYLDDPLTRDELGELERRLGRPAAEWVRRGQAEFQAAGLGANPSADAILEAMAAHPILTDRPIVVRGGSARLGRPPEEVLSLFA